jgi:hypothetical protein
MFKGHMLRGGLIAVLAVVTAVVVAGCCGMDTCGGCETECCEAAPPPCTQCGPLPADALPGQAWCCVMIPPQFEEVETQVCTCPASCTKEWVPPEYEEQSHQVCVKPAGCRQVQIPGEWKDETQQVLVCPARTEWKRVECTPEQLAAGEKQGECWMLVEVPATYRTCTTRVCVRQPSCETVEEPAQYETVTERVCTKPGYYKEIPTPAQYETRKSQRCVSPARWEWRRNEACEVPQAGPAPAEGATEAAPK